MTGGFKLIMIFSFKKFHSAGYGTKMFLIHSDKARKCFFGASTLGAFYKNSLRGVPGVEKT